MKITSKISLIGGIFDSWPEIMTTLNHESEIFLVDQIQLKMIHSLAHQYGGVSNNGP